MTRENVSIHNHQRPLILWPSQSQALEKLLTFYHLKALSLYIFEWERQTDEKNCKIFLLPIWVPLGSDQFTLTDEEQKKRLVHNILETFATHAPLMMLLIPTARHKMAALMFAFQWLSTINLLTKRMRNQVKKCCMSICHSIPICVKAHDASLVWSP